MQCEKFKKSALTCGTAPDWIKTFKMGGYTVKLLSMNKLFIIPLVLSFFSALILVVPPHVLAQFFEPVVAIHVSEQTQALDTMNNGWWTSWHYFVIPESLKEALRSDGTPFVEVSDADIAGGSLFSPDGSPRYPILISLAAEAIDNNEIDPLRDYVAAGGFLFVGSSAFTRNADGTTRGDFALANELGLHMVRPSLQNWGTNMVFSKVAEHRLVAHVPAGTITWRMPLSSEEIPDGVSPSHSVHGSHYVFRVSADSGTTVIANGDSGPLVATRQYGKGNFVYYGAMQPLIGYGEYDPAMYAYLIYRHAIEWAFEVANYPIIRLSPWRYDYNAAFVVRHDFENSATSIRSIENSASFEHSVGAQGNYYFCTGTLRQQMPDKSSVVASLKRAVTNYGATIGSHNGGLKNPVNTSLSSTAFDYWHWGPDEALDVTPRGYTSGKAYAQSSISMSFQDIEGWLAGVDNGRAGCGSAGNCPRIWVSPYFNSAREDSYGILQDLNVLSTGEQTIGPYPHWTLSYETPNKRYSHITNPVSEWYVGSEIPGALEWGHTTNSIHEAVDFYYNLGAMINLYSHEPSNESTLIGQYVKYCAAKPRMWATNAVGISDWWKVRSTTVVTPAYSMIGNTTVAQATITGSTDAETAIDVALPSGNNLDISNIQVFINDELADPADYRIVGNVIRVRVGISPSSAKVQYAINNVTSTTSITTTSLRPNTTTTVRTTTSITTTSLRPTTTTTVRTTTSTILTTSTSSTTTTAVTTQPYCDDFESGLSKWGTNYNNGFVTTSISGGGKGAMASLSGGNGIVYGTACNGVDQYVKMKYVTTCSGDWYYRGPIFRYTNSSTAFYAVYHLSGDSGTPDWQFCRHSNFIDDPVCVTATGSPTVTAGKYYGFVMKGTGSNLRVYIWDLGTTKANSNDQPDAGGTTWTIGGVSTSPTKTISSSPGTAITTGNYTGLIVYNYSTCRIVFDDFCTGDISSTTSSGLTTTSSVSTTTSSTTTSIRATTSTSTTSVPTTSTYIPTTTTTVRPTTSSTPSTTTSSIKPLTTSSTVDLTTTTTIPTDSDGDGVPDTEDNCLNTPNGPQLGTCTPGSDKTGATCTSDADCANVSSYNGKCSLNQEDSDEDGAGDICDNCPVVCNPGQLDAEEDGRGDLCDPDPNCGGCSTPACEEPCSTTPFGLLFP
jgi:hypothetical protein